MLLEEVINDRSENILPPPPRLPHTTSIFHFKTRVLFISVLKKHTSIRNQCYGYGGGSACI